MTMARGSCGIELISYCGILFRSFPIMLRGDQIVHGVGEKKRITKLSDISVIRLETTSHKKFRLVLHEIGGNKVVIT